MGDVYLPTGEGCSLIYWVIMTDSCRAMTCLKTVLGLKKKKKKTAQLHVQRYISEKFSINP